MPHIAPKPAASSAKAGSLMSRLFKGDSKHASLPEGKAAGFSSTLAQTYMSAPGQPVWMRREYHRFADEAYVKNVIAHRAISMIAEGAASVSLKVEQKDEEGNVRALPNHPLAKLLKRPNPLHGMSQLLQALHTHRLISGNAYLQAHGAPDVAPIELHVLRPDRVNVLAGKGGTPAGYRYQVGNHHTDFPVNGVNGSSRILHVKAFHPLDDWYGLSPVEAAAYSIDQHNHAGAWNQSLLQNGARPSGALVVKANGDGVSGTLSEEQYHRIKGQMEEQFSGADNAGRPLLLEGGLDWKEMSLSPKDMDFIEMKHSAARDIALAFGVPPQLLGIPGDNTYSNLAEARLALWEQNIIPAVQQLVDGLNNWLTPMFGNDVSIVADTQAVPALSLKREKLWQRINEADFLSDEEKKTMLGLN